jgi:hypothetical protein
VIPAESGDDIIEELRSARRYQYTAHDIASALVAVSRGESYAAAGEQIRLRASVRWGLPLEKDKRRRHGTLVSDWVEVYAPALWQARTQHERDWPDTVFLGQLPVVVHGRLVFSVLAAAAYEPGGQMQIFATSIADGTGAAAWTQFLGELRRARPGTPSRIVGDGSLSIRRGVAAAWPASEPARPELWRDEQLMRDEARRILRERGLDRRDNALWTLSLRAWRSPQDWQLFTATAGRYRIPELDRWLVSAEVDMSRQFAGRRTGSRRSRNPLETALVEMGRRIRGRQGSFANRERTERLLSLMALDLSGSANANSWAAAICAWLEQAGGRPDILQRSIADRDGSASLRRRRRAAAVVE